MSLLMEALKKAERAKQGQTDPKTGQSGQPGEMAETPNSIVAPRPEISLLPQGEAAGHVNAAGRGDFPAIDTAHVPQSAIPDLAPMPTEGQSNAPACVEQLPAALELTLATDDSARDSARSGVEPPSWESRLQSVSPASIAATGVEPKAQPSTSSKSGADVPPVHRTEPRNKVPAQDVRKIVEARQQAKTVFSAKQPARSRALLLTGSAIAIIFGLVGFGVYYWQITSTSTMLIPVGTPPPTSASALAAPVDTGSQQQGTPAVSDKPVLSPVEEPAPVAGQARPPAAETVYAPARAETHSGSESFKENPAIRIRQSAATSQLNPTLGKAYQSFLSGDTGTAQQLYHKVLQQEPNNRDALLGLAAIALKQKQAGQAAAYYGKLIELDPADPEALAALIGLKGQSDPVQSESRLKKILMQNPQADAVHFALGNLYTQQSRWAEAQQSYFRAYSSAPGNADYVFNLAVSLDHLNQGKLALDYYQRALTQPGPTNFDKSSVQARIKELQQPAGN